MSKRWQRVCASWSLLTFSSCISILFILWVTHRTGVRGQEDHRGALLCSQVCLTAADWAIWAQLPDWPIYNLTVCLTVSLTDILTPCQFDYLSHCLSVWLTDSPAGLFYLEALMLRWVGSFLTWTHKRVLHTDGGLVLHSTNLSRQKYITILSTGLQYPSVEVVCK